MSHPRIGIGVLIFKQQHLLLGQRKGSHGALTWSPPGGHLEFGEALEACALREVKEETGLELAAPKLLAMTNDIFHQEKKHYVTIFFRADFPADQVVQNLEPEKLIKWEWINVNTLPENLFLPMKNLLAQYGNEILI